MKLAARPISSASLSDLLSDERPHFGKMYASSFAGDQGTLRALKSSLPLSCDQRTTSQLLDRIFPLLAHAIIRLRLQPAPSRRLPPQSRVKAQLA